MGYMKKRKCPDCKRIKLTWFSNDGINSWNNRCVECNNKKQKEMVDK